MLYTIFRNSPPVDPLLLLRVSNHHASKNSSSIITMVKLAIATGKDNIRPKFTDFLVGHIATNMTLFVKG